MTFQTTIPIALALLLILSAVGVAADCRTDKEELGPGDWLVTQDATWPATIHATDEFDRSLQLLVRGQVCETKGGEPLTGAGIQLIRFEQIEGAERPLPRFSDLVDGGGDGFKVVDRVTAIPDDSGNVRASVKPGHYAVVAIDSTGNPIGGPLVFDLRVIQGFANALAYGEITNSR